MVPHLAVRLQFPHTALSPGQSSRTPALHGVGLLLDLLLLTPLPAQGYGRTCSHLAVAKGLQGFELLLPFTARCPVHQQPRALGMAGPEDVKSSYAPETAVHRIRPGLKSGQQRS